MNPSTLQIALFVAEQLLKESPTIYLSFVQMLSKSDITVEEIQARRVALLSQKFEDLVPHSELPPE